VLFNQVSKGDPEKIFMVCFNVEADDLLEGELVNWKNSTLPLVLIGGKNPLGLQVFRSLQTASSDRSIAGVVKNRLIPKQGYGLVQTYGFCFVRTDAGANVTVNSPVGLSSAEAGRCNLYNPTISSLNQFYFIRICLLSSTDCGLLSPPRTDQAGVFLNRLM